MINNDIFKFVEFFGVQSKIYYGGIRDERNCIRSPRLKLGKKIFGYEIIVRLHIVNYM